MSRNLHKRIKYNLRIAVSHTSMMIDSMMFPLLYNAIAQVPDSMRMTIHKCAHSVYPVGLARMAASFDLNRTPFGAM